MIGAAEMADGGPAGADRSAVVRRRVSPERMDDPGVDPGELREALGFIRGVNRRLGGTQALLRHLRRWSARWEPGRSVTLLDIGTGSADLPIAARAWAERAGFDLRITGVDLHERTLEVAREQVKGREGIELLRADALELDRTFGARSFDYVHAGMFLHHLPNEIQILTALAIMDRLAVRGIVWNDLTRGRLERAFVGLATLGRGPMVRHDARVSVEAGFTRREVLEYRARVGLDYTRYERMPLAGRFTLAGERG